MVTVTVASNATFQKGNMLYVAGDEVSVHTWVAERNRFMGVFEPA